MDPPTRVRVSALAFNQKVRMQPRCLPLFRNRSFTSSAGARTRMALRAGSFPVTRASRTHRPGIGRRKSRGDRGSHGNSPVHGLVFKRGHLALVVYWVDRQVTRHVAGGEPDRPDVRRSRGANRDVRGRQHVLVVERVIIRWIPVREQPDPGTSLDDDAGACCRAGVRPVDLMRCGCTGGNNPDDRENWGTPGQVSTGRRRRRVQSRPAVRTVLRAPATVPCSMRED